MWNARTIHWKVELSWRGVNGDPPPPPKFDVIELLCSVFNSIEHHGVSPGTGFSDGWMCPIFKKKDATDIANYRPITVLNTDYKIFMKALTFKLTEVVPSLIHKNQAGFMKGRKISDQIFLTTEMVEYAEDELQNGVILALDQEKAYDKTSHHYLWQVM